MFDLERWQREVAQRLVGWRESAAFAGAVTLYGFLGGVALGPVAAALARGEFFDVGLALGTVGASVGGNLLANEVQRWKDGVDEPEAKVELERWLTEQVATNADIRKALDAVLDKVAVLPAAQAALPPADYAWFATTLHAELARLDLPSVKQWLTNSGIITGDITTGANSEVVIGTKIVYPSPPDPAAQARETARQRYLRLLGQRCNVLPLLQLGSQREASNEVGLKDVYVALATTSQVELTQAEKQALSRSLRGEQTHRPLLAQEVATRHRRLVLLGEPGGGKSTFVRQLVIEAARAYEHGQPLAPGWEVGLLPVLLLLRDLAPRLEGLELPEGQEPRERQLRAALWAFWQEALADLDAAAFEPELRQALAEGKALLLFDGLDEVAPALRGRVRDAIRALLVGYPTGLRVLVTCRVRSYSGEARLEDFEQATLAPFDREKIGEFVAAWYGAQVRLERMDEASARTRRDDLQQAALAPDLQELAANPMLLTTMALIHQRDVGLPRERVRLYQQAVELLLGRWQKFKRAHLTPVLEALLQDERRLRLVMERLGYEAHQAQSRGEGVGDLARGDLMAILEEPELLGEAPAREFLDYVDQRAGLLVGRGGDEAGGRPALYAFPHRTFQEYLAGCYLVRGRPREVVAEYWQRVGEGDFWQVAAQLGAEELYYLRGGEKEVLDLAYALCPVTTPPNVAAWRAVVWSGQLAALMGVAEIERDAEQPSGDAAYLPRLRERLMGVMRGSALPATERAAAGRALALLGDPRPEVTAVDAMHFCCIPPGSFWMGSPDEDKMGLDSEGPLHPVAISYGYGLGRYPVTNAQYSEFMAAGGYAEERYWAELAAQGAWRAGQIKPEYENEWSDEPLEFAHYRTWPTYPVVGVSFYEALAFTRWLTERWQAAGRLPLGWAVVLPSEAEWEKGARGGETLPDAALPPRPVGPEMGALALPAQRPNLLPQRRFPWGNDPDPQRASYSDTNLGDPSAVGCFAAGVGEYALEEMSGNVWEWTRSHFIGYPYSQEGPERLARETLALHKDRPRVLRGGSFASNGRAARCAYRLRLHPHDRRFNCGFRVAVSPAPLSSGPSDL